MPTVETIIQDAAKEKGWETPADFHRALTQVGSAATYNSAWNWWNGRGVPSGVNAAHVADVCGVDAVTIYELATPRGRPAIVSDR